MLYFHWKHSVLMTVTFLFIYSKKKKYSRKFSRFNFSNSFLKYNMNRTFLKGKTLLFNCSFRTQLIYKDLFGEFIWRIFCSFVFWKVKATFLKSMSSVIVWLWLRFAIPVTEIWYTYIKITPSNTDLKKKRII